MDRSTGRERISYRYEVFGMDGWEAKKIEDLSKGMQQKVQFVATVLHEPDLSILDEAFSGLDPVNTNLLKDEIRKLKEYGTTILISTQRMERVEEIFERIALMNLGDPVLEGDMEA